MPPGAFDSGQSGDGRDVSASLWQLTPRNGSMLLESFAACTLQPGVYFAVNSPPGVVGATPAAAAATISSWGFPVSVIDMSNLARDAGEKTLFARTGGAPSLALGRSEEHTSELQ